MLLSNLPEHIARREVQELQRLTGWEPDCFRIENASAQGPGNVVLLQLIYDHVSEVFIGFGEQGVKAEEVARRAVDEMRLFQLADVPVGPHLADQLLLLLGLAAWQKSGSSTFRTCPLTRHSLTQIDVLKAFLGVTTSVTSREGDKSVEVSVR